MRSCACSSFLKSRNQSRAQGGEHEDARCAVWGARSHYALNITYGITLLSAVRGAERAPSLIIAMKFRLVTFEGAFAMFTNILVEYSLGDTGWIAMFGGSLIATALAILLLSRTHPLA
jgi:hypothetical protein